MIILYILAGAFALDMVGNSGSGFRTIVNSFKEGNEESDSKFESQTALNLLSEIDDLRDDLLNDSNSEAEVAMINEKIKDRQKMIGILPILTEEVLDELLKED